MRLKAGAAPHKLLTILSSRVIQSCQLTRLKITEIAMVATLTILAGCNSIPNETDAITAGSKATGSTAQVEKQFVLDMAEGLVTVLPQILEPLSTTVQFNDALSGDIGPVVVLLADLSYGLQRVSADQGKYFLSLEDISTPVEKEIEVTRLRLSLGSIELSRSYQIISQRADIVQGIDINWRDGRGVVPVSPLQVAGTRLPIQLNGMELDDSMGVAESKLFIASRVEYTESAPIRGGIPTISLITSDLVQQVADSSFPTRGGGIMFVDSFKEGVMPHVDDGAFASLADNYERVGRETIIFPNDSQFLGRSGKLQVKKVLNRFSRNTDIVGIVGCSNGRTQLSIGNEGLALGRAKRIAEEFYSAGLARDKVFNEGCWSSESGADGFPNRGVVIDLWRRKV